jgi:non-ribosomal peptide synthase protein (TIGR01720 family)
MSDTIDDRSSIHGFDFSRVPDHEIEPALNVALASLQASLNIELGPVFLAAYFDFGPVRPGRLAMMGHCLAIDEASLRILIEDLKSDYGRPDKAEESAPAPGVAARYAEHLSRLAERADLAQELSCWLDPSRRNVLRIPLDFQGGENTETSCRVESVSLDAAWTRALLEEARRAYNTEITDLLLTAIVQSLSAWSRGRSFLIALKGDGRNIVDERIDLSRAVGQMSFLFPALLSLPAQSGTGAAVMAIKEQLRSVPNKGIGYWLLLYPGRDESTANKLRALPQPEISFEFLSQPELTPAENRLFKSAPDLSPLPAGQRNRRLHAIEIKTAIREGRLQFDWLYSENLHHRSTISAIASETIRATESIITHCRSVNETSFTPSDFPLINLSKQQLDSILKRAARAKLQQPE